MNAEASQISAETIDNRRGSPRTILPTIEVRIDGAFYSVEDWSLGGCRLVGYEGDLQPGSMAAIGVFLRGCREHEGMAVEAEVMRFEAGNDNALALKFVDLQAKDIMAYCDAVEKSMTSGSKSSED